MPATTKSRLSLPKLPKRESNAVPRSQIERLWLVAGGLVAFVMLLIGYFFFISPQRSNTSDINNQTATAQQQNAMLQARLDALREQNKNLAKYQAELASAQLALPSTSGISDFLRTLQSLGTQTNSLVTGLNVGEPVDVTPVTVGQPTSSATASASPTASPGTDSSTAAAAPGATTPGVYELPITATVTGSVSGLTEFLDQLQAVQPRAVLVTQIGMNVANAGVGDGGNAAGSYGLNLTMQAFVAPTNAEESAALASSAAAH
jgi:Tfp pilus assembly protein PilO